MDQAVSTERATGSPPNPVDDAGLCLLSLDGGGVRGLSTLHILKSLMMLLNHERQKSGASALKPCELFDLIGGTSTGGLIAIMLGRLEMDVDECITAYNRLIKAVFEEKAHRTPFSWSGRVQSRFDSAKLKRVIDDVITSQGRSPTEPFNDGKPRGCKVFVCTVAKDLYGITRLRSYDLPHKPSVPATISEAALATSAATGFFDPVSIGARQFVDGALGVNNPVEEVEGEATDIWSAETGDVKSLVKCFISVGTGNPGKKAIEDSLLNFLSKTLVQITTETEETAKRFVARWRQHLDQNRYFRLNVEQGLQEVGLAEYNNQGRIETATHDYLDEQHQISRVRHCVANLKQKQRKTDISLVDENKVSRILSLSVRSPILYGIDLYSYSDPGRAVLPCHYIPLPPNKRFVGREEVVETLRQRLLTSDDGQVVSLVGLGGVGKTQVAFQIAYWTKEYKPDHSVFWVSAISDASFEQTYTEIAKKLSVRKHSEDEEVRESVRRSLESEDSGQWLLVVDNADNMDILFGSSENPGIFQYLPQSGTGRVLFTTRSREVALAVGGAMVELAEMNAQEATALLEKSLVQKDLLSDAKTVRSLLQELTYLPLAITQAAAYLNRNRVAIDKYVELLRGTEPDLVGLMSREFQDSTRSRESRHAVATTWLVSFQQIQKSDALAADLLAFLSCIDPKSIPQSILPLFSSEEAMVFALGTLDVYAFVTRRGDTGTFDMHSLVHLATRIWVRRDRDAAKVEESAVQHLASIFPPGDYSQRDRWRAYLLHAFRTLRRADTVNLEERYTLCLKVALCLQVDGRIREAVRFFQECCDWRTVCLNKAHPSRLSSQHALARAYQANGQVKEAVALLEEVVQMKTQSLAADHPDRLASQHELAGVYQANGQVTEAVALLEEVVQIQAQSLAADHPDRLASQHTLAGAYEVNGQVKEAVALLEEVVQIKTQSLAADHPSQLASQHELAGAYQANGQVTEAVALLKEVVQIRAQSLAADHPSQLASQHALARAYRANGQVTEAVALLKEVVQIQSQSLAADHPGQLASQHNLAIYLWELGWRHEAYTMMNYVMTIRKQVLDVNHPSQQSSKEWLDHFREQLRILEERDSAL